MVTYHSANAASASTPTIVNRVSAHGPQSPVVTSVYARLANESARAVLERHAEAVLSAVAGSDAPTNLASPSGET
jgi:hypothetical protein